MLELYTSKQDWRNLKHGAIKTTIMAGNGIFELQKGWLGSSLKKADKYATVIYPELTEELTIENRDNTPTVPKEAILYVIKWYSTITNKNGEEAQINFYYTKGKESITVNDKEMKLRDIPGVYFWKDDLFSYTPLQYNSGALTEVDDEIYTEINKQIGFYVETHSHNSMGAFASGTDLANSKNDAIQLVFGRLNTNEVEMHTWATVCGVTREKLTEDELKLYVDMPDYTMQSDKYYINKNELDQVDFNEETLENWSKQIKIRPARVYKTNDNFNKSKKYNTGKQTSLFDDDAWDGYDWTNYSTSSYKSLEERLIEVSEVAKSTLTEPITFNLTIEDIVDVFTAGGNIARYSSKTDDEILSDIYDVISILIDEDKANL